MPAPIVEIDLEFPYTHGGGPITGAYLDGLEAGRRSAHAAGRTRSPPLEYDPATGGSVEDSWSRSGPKVRSRRGRGWKMTDDGSTEMTGSFPVNPSGGVLSSNPIGASA